MTDHPLEIALVLNSHDTDSQIAIALLRAGFTVYICANGKELQTLVQSGKRPIVLSDAILSRGESDPTALSIIGQTPAAAQPQLAAILAAIERHRPSDWRLSSHPRRLISPQERFLPLTMSEWHFMQELLRRPEQTLAYEDWQTSRPADLARKARNLAVLVNRLRDKASRLRIALPLESIRRYGYRFAAPCITDLADKRP